MSAAMTHIRRAAKQCENAYKLVQEGRKRLALELLHIAKLDIQEAIEQIKRVTDPDPRYIGPKYDVKPGPNPYKLPTPSGITKRVK